MQAKSRITALMLGILFSLMAPAALAEESAGFGQSVDGLFGVLVGWVATATFWDVLFFVDGVTLPFAVAWLIVGAVYFTFRMGFINIRAFSHAIQCVRGKYDDPNDIGETTHFQALSTALSATVGLGNIAGVAIAISIGGPGATFWMIVAGFFGMAAKFTECTLGQMYRQVRPDGHVMGGAMEYLSRGLAEKGMGTLGKVLAVMFCVMCIGGALGAGNAFQVSQSLSAVKQSVPAIAEDPWIYGVIMAILVGLVIIGGIKRIAKVTQAVVPAMCGIYIAACIWVILVNIDLVPETIVKIIAGAFTPEAGLGGLIGVLVVGFQRAAFSSEAGIGSAAIAHSTARTKYPVREGIVALLEPFIDTIVVCTMTALVIVITGVYNSPETAELVASKQGAALTGVAFGSVISWFPIILTISVVLFAFSTMISWSYYGERCWSYLFGDQSAIAFKLIFVVVVYLGAVSSASNILDFSDLMILSMAFPNILGLYLLQDKVRDALGEYMKKFRNGDFDREIVEK
ncbi:alanine/glycine:cation symporter family protein [Pseudomonadota bacterium]